MVIKPFLDNHFHWGCFQHAIGLMHETIDLIENWQDCQNQEIKETKSIGWWFLRVTQLFMLMWDIADTQEREKGWSQVIFVWALEYQGEMKGSLKSRVDRQQKEEKCL